MKNWIDAKTLFETLNENYAYLVIRNFETFYDSILMDSHADIDILCHREDKKAIVQLLDAKPRLEKEDGIHFQIQIAHETVPMDVRCTGDGYYDTRWEKQMLSDRVLDSRGFYRMDQENYFWSLLYHALYQKGYISEEYFSRLESMKPSCFPANATELEASLSTFMQENDYYYTIGRDPFLWYHFTECCKGRIRAYPLYKIKRLMIHCREFISNKLTKRRKQ